MLNPLDQQLYNPVSMCINFQNYEFNRKKAEYSTIISDAWVHHSEGDALKLKGEYNLSPSCKILAFITVCFSPFSVNIVTC